MSTILQTLPDSQYVSAKGKGHHQLTLLRDFGGKTVRGGPQQFYICLNCGLDVHAEDRHLLPNARCRKGAIRSQREIADRIAEASAQQVYRTYRDGELHDVTRTPFCAGCDLFHWECRR